jgi:hypothetical protein
MNIADDHLEDLRPYRAPTFANPKPRQPRPPVNTNKSPSCSNVSIQWKNNSGRRSASVLRPIARSPVCRVAGSMKQNVQTPQRWLKRRTKQRPRRRRSPSARNQAARHCRPVFRTRADEAELLRAPLKRSGGCRLRSYLCLVLRLVCCLAPDHTSSNSARARN